LYSEGQHDPTGLITLADHYRSLGFVEVKGRIGGLRFLSEPS
jgi:hypothetical protein